VFAEVILALFPLPYGSLWERIDTAAIDAAIAFGIIGEVIFSRKDARIQTELRRLSNAELTESKRRLVEADEEIARLMDHVQRSNEFRTVNADIFAESIKDLPKGNVIVLYERHVPDASHLAVMLAGAFQKAGWDTETGNDFSPVVLPSILPWHVPPTTITGHQKFGISVTAKRFAHNDASDPLNVLSRAIFKSGAETSVSHGSDPQLPENTIRLIVCAKAVSWPMPRAQIEAMKKVIAMPQ